MTNAEKFRNVFGLYATELWSMQEKEFLEWLNTEMQPERKKGKWTGADSQCGIGCPFCGTPVDDFCSSIDHIDLNYEPNFCPNCGARMMEDEQNEQGD